MIKSKLKIKHEIQCDFPSQPTRLSVNRLAPLLPLCLPQPHPALPHSCLPNVHPYSCLRDFRSFLCLKHSFPSSGCGHSSSASECLRQALPDHSPYGSPLARTPLLAHPSVFLHSSAHLLVTWLGPHGVPERAGSSSFLLTAASPVPRRRAAL